MRGFLLGITAFARTAASFGGQGGCALVKMQAKSHPQIMAKTSSNVGACSENRYPSPLARSVLPPHGPRHSFSGRGGLLFPASGAGRCFAEALRVCEMFFAQAVDWARIHSVITTSRAEKCANPFLFSASSLPLSSRAACLPTVNVPSQVPQQVQLSPMRPTTTRSQARLSVRSRAPIATTQVFVTDHYALTGAQARRFETIQKRFPGQPVRGAFFMLETFSKAAGRQRAVKASTTIERCMRFRFKSCFNMDWKRFETTGLIRGWPAKTRSRLWQL